jgi:hypothetical protein
MKYNKSIIVPIIALICLAIKQFIGVDIDEGVQGQVVDIGGSVVALVATLYGIFKNHK